MAKTDAAGLLKFLQSIVPAATPVTISSEINLLESLEIISNEKAVSAMRTAALLIPPDTPATFRGLVNMLAQLMKMNPKITDAHRKTIDESLALAGQGGDFPLTFGTFLPICQKLLERGGRRKGTSA